MAKQRLLFIFSFFVPALCCGQGLAADTLAYKRKIVPSIYIDFGKLLTLPGKQETKYEGGIELLFLEKFPLIMEAGFAILNPDQAFSNGTYESRGTYFRVGTGFYSQFSPKNTIGFTLRYGSGLFRESALIQLKSASGAQGTTTIPITHAGLSASWFETVIYSDKKINKHMAIGLNIRLRVLIEYNEQRPIDVYSIPGYGRSFDKSIPAVNLFLKISF